MAYSLEELEHYWMTPLTCSCQIGMALFWVLRWKVCLWIMGPWSIVAKFCWRLNFALSPVWIRAFYCWIYEISLWKRKIIFLSALILPMRTKTQKADLWVFVAVHGLSLVATSRGYCLSRGMRVSWPGGFSCCRALVLEHRLSSWGAWA